MNNEESFTFCGSPCTLNENCGIFITMNPNYVGRSQLPDNLKALFRPIAMMIPNYQLIAEVQLFSEGFNNSKNLSSKMMKLYKLSSEQLSQKTHYDFGMRSIKSVLEMAGTLKRSFPEQDETKLLIRSMRDSNVPKFLRNDLKLFNALVKDLFPELDLPESEHSRLKHEIHAVLSKKTLQPKPKIVQKICQIYDMINARFGVVLLGDSLVGKTSSLTTLKESMTSLYNHDLVEYKTEQKLSQQKKNRSNTKDLISENNYDDLNPDEEAETYSPEKIGSKFCEVQLTELNPKAVSKGELFGQENELTKDWSDGIASHYIRKAAENHDSTFQSWISFDGPVDSLWIEDMNSVLDQSRILCLSNGQRIRLNNKMRIIFEVNDLSNASLATITRCGMVFFPAEALGWDSLLISWLKKLEVKKEKGSAEYLLNRESFQIISNLCASFLPKLVEVFRLSPKVVPLSVFQVIRTFCDIFEALLEEERGFRAGAPMEFKSQYITLSFIFSSAWAFGGSLLNVDDKRPSDRIDALIKKRFNTMDYLTEPVLNCFVDPINTILRPFNDLLKKSESAPEDLDDSKYSVSQPENSISAVNNFGNIVDGVSCELDSRQNNSFAGDQPFWEILVSTTDTLKISNVCSILCRSRRNVFLLGGSGAGKSVVSEKLLMHLSSKRQIDNIKFFFSAQTEASMVYEGVLNQLYTQKRNVKGAQLGREMMIFVEDVNMPETETYGAQPPIEILRQIMDKKMLYHKQEMEEIQIVDTSLFVLAAPPEGGRNPLDPRFMGHFGVVAFSLPETQTIQRIFSSILENQLLGFEDIVRNISSDIVQASVEFYEKIIKTKRPTPSKFHYTFNLRDLSRVFMGLSRADENSFQEPVDLISLWGHEMTRVFHDRLSCYEDREWFFNTLDAIIERIFKMRPDQVNCRNSLFSDVYTIDMEEQFYEKVQMNSQLVKTFNDFQIDYNECPGKKLELVFFDYAVKHLVRILRILSQSRGNGLLIGVGGLGKQSLTRLAAFILKQEIKSLPGMNKFNRDKFREWLFKEILVKCAGPDAGPLGVPTCLIVADSMISSETIFEYMSNLLNSGEVPNLFPEEDQKKLFKGMMELFSGNLDEKTLWKRFVARVRDNLHIMMCMSPVGDNLRFRCRQFPALIDCCSINWFDDWESSAVENVSVRILESTDVPLIPKVAHVLRFIHEFGVEASQHFMMTTGRKCFITPKNALDNVELVNRLYTIRQNRIHRQRETLICGSVKLEETSKLVEKLKVDLTEAQPLLEQKRKETENKMKELEKATIINQEKRQQVEQEKKKKQSLNEQIESFNNDVEQQLSKIRPTLEQAETDVRNINPKDIFSLRTLVIPPENIENVIKNVCLTLGIKYASWKQTGLKVLNDTNKFISSLIDKIEEIKVHGSSVIPDQTMKLLTKALGSKCFSAEYLSKNSFARPLGLWVRAVYEFVELKKTVEPLERQAKKINKELQVAKEEFENILKQLKVCKEKMINLQEDYSSMENQKKELETNIESTKLKLDRAEKLTSLLIDENLRWKESIREYDQQMKYLLSDAIMSASIISYAGPFDGQNRARLLKKFKQLLYDFEGIIFSNKYCFLEVMGDPLELKEWCRFGLPSDEESQTSALISQNSLKWPFMIDPQKQASTWLKNMLKYDDDLVIVSNNLEEAKKMQIMKMALINGKVVLLENVPEVLESSFESIFSRQYFENKIEKRKLIEFNEETIDYHDDFQLFVTTKVSNPNFLPDVFIKMNVINFTVTLLGLEEQLLAEVVKLEQPNVETQKNNLIEKVSNYKKKLLDFEEKILNLLADSGTLIEDEKLVSTLQNSKTMSDDIKEKVKTSVEISKKIEEAREQFRPVAKRGSILFFAVRDMSGVDSMYQYSLHYIIKIFKNAIRRSEQSEKIISRLHILIINISSEIYKNISRGLFERHKLIFSFLMSCRIGLAEKQITESSWEMLLRGTTSFGRSNNPTNPDPSFISEEAWDIICRLAEKNFMYSSLCQSVYHNIDEWRKIMQTQSILDTDFRRLVSWKSIKSSSFNTKVDSRANPADPSGEDQKSVRFGTEPEKLNESSKTSNYVNMLKKSDVAESGPDSEETNKSRFINSSNASSRLESLGSSKPVLKVYDMNLFDKLLFIKIFKPNKLLTSISKYVERTLGPEYLSSNAESINSCKTPIRKGKKFFKKKTTINSKIMTSDAYIETLPVDESAEFAIETKNQIKTETHKESEEEEEYKGSLQLLVENTDPETPIIFVLTRGADPSSIVKNLGDKMGFYIYEKLLTISLGQEQGPRAEKLIRRAKEEGLWVMLENCHLAKSWLPNLEEIIEKLQETDKDKIHSDFRLFLTSMPAKYFPVSILENGVKITTEPPKGLRNNMLRSVKGIQESFFRQEQLETELANKDRAKSQQNIETTEVGPVSTEKTDPADQESVRTNQGKSFNLPTLQDPQRPSISTHVSSQKVPTQINTNSNQPSSRESFSTIAKSRLVTSLSLFHAIIQERKNFGAIGWNKPYDFNDSDFFAVKDILNLMVEGAQNKKEIPWESIFFLTGVITYGGRVTDNQDKRLLKCLLRKFFNEQILDERCRFWGDKRYKIPRVACKADILEYVDSLPALDPPEICGLHPNATISFQKQEINRILNTLVDICPQQSVSPNFNLNSGSMPSSTENLDHVSPEGALEGEVKSLQISLIEGILEDLPEPILLKFAHKMHTKREENGLISPLSTVLFQEVERYNRLIRTIRSLLKNLKESAQGLMSITPELDEVSISLKNNRVPLTWKKVAYPSLRGLGSWLKDLKLRVEFMSYWMVHGTVPHFWLPGFFFPQGFLTGVLQTHSRNLNMPVDKFSFVFKITDQETHLYFKDFSAAENSKSKGLKKRDSKRKRNQPTSSHEKPKHNFQKKRMTRFIGNHGNKGRHSIRIRKNNSNQITEDIPDGVFISGLHLEGADWDKRRKLLIEQASGSMNYSMPLIHFLPSEKAENKGNWYSCPLYKTPDRQGTLNSTGTSTNYILDVALPCDKNRDLWVLRGVALFCEINE